MAMSGRNKKRSSTSAARYQQEYPPPSEQILSYIATTPIRRASSESKLLQLQQKDVQANIKSVYKHREEDNRTNHRVESSQGVTDRESQELGAETASARNITVKEDSETTYLNMEFEACIQEHPNTQAIPKLINFLGIGYKYTKLVVYYILVILVGVPMTFVWGFLTGSTVFCCVWLWGPALKIFTLCCHLGAPVIYIPFQVICAPIVDVAARIFRQVRMQAIILGQPTVKTLASQKA